MSRLLVLLALAGCGAQLDLRSAPLDPNSLTAQRWAHVLSEPAVDAPPALSDFVRWALVSDTRFRLAQAKDEAAVAEQLVSGILPLALEASGEARLEALGRHLRSRPSDGESAMREAILQLHRRGVACRAYRSVLLGHPERPASKLEDAFVALEVAYFSVRSEPYESAAAAPSHCADLMPTAHLDPTYVPYLAVAAGADPEAVRLSVIRLLQALHRS